jgi:hypothetical protein
MTRRAPRVSRREFLSRLRSGEHGRTLELSCQMLFMRCHDATLAGDAAPVEYEPWMGEPPAVFARRTPDDILTSLAGELEGVQVLRLLEPEWLDHLAGAERLSAIIAAFRDRGGRIERGN